MYKNLNKYLTSGMIRFNIISISSLHNDKELLIEMQMSNIKSNYLTSGSQLSFNAKLADV